MFCFVVFFSRVAGKAIIILCGLIFPYFSWSILSCCFLQVSVCFFCVFATNYFVLPKLICGTNHLDLFLSLILLLKLTAVLTLSVVVHHERSSHDFVSALLHPTFFFRQRKKRFWTKTMIIFTMIQLAGEPRDEGSGSLTCAEFYLPVPCETPSWVPSKYNTADEQQCDCGRHVEAGD